jgi:hypothetical protein
VIGAIFVVNTLVDTKQAASEKEVVEANAERLRAHHVDRQRERYLVLRVAILVRPHILVGKRQAVVNRP